MLFRSHSDLTLQDFRTRDRMWTLSRRALDFFTKFSIPFWKMSIANTLLTKPTINSCLASANKNEIIIYLPDGGMESVALPDIPLNTTYSINWYDQLLQGTIRTISGGGLRSIGQPRSVNTTSVNTTKDWAVYLKKIS